MRLLVFFTILLILPALVYAQSGFESAQTHVYVYDVPDISIYLVNAEDGLICSWDIEDLDKEDTFAAEVVWKRNGAVFAQESIDCGSLKNCAAHERPEYALGETWTCSVLVEDSYGAEAVGSADFYEAPLGFFSGLLRNLLSFLGLA